MLCVQQDTKKCVEAGMCSRNAAVSVCTTNPLPAHLTALLITGPGYCTDSAAFLSCVAKGGIPSDAAANLAVRVP